DARRVLAAFLIERDRLRRHRIFATDAFLNPDEGVLDAAVLDGEHRRRRSLELGAVGRRRDAVHLWHRALQRDGAADGGRAGLAGCLLLLLIGAAVVTAVAGKDEKGCESELHGGKV